MPTTSVNKKLHKEVHTVTNRDFMASDSPCAKCGSAHIVPDAPVISRSEFKGLVSLSVARKPDALLFRAEELADVRARVCGDCGHVEMFVRGARALYRAHKESMVND